MTKRDKDNPIIHSNFIRGLLGIGALLTFSLLNGCSSAQKDSNSFEPIPVDPVESLETPQSTDPTIQAPLQAQTQPQTPSQKDEIQKLLINLSDKMEALDQKLNSLNDKLNTTRTTLDQINSKKSIGLAEFALTDTNKSGSPVEASPPSDDPEGGYINDEAVQSFRKSILLYHGQKYPESILAFSQFIEHHPDHPMVGSAQFYIGASYSRQKEYLLAIQEFGRVLSAHENSPRISDTLSELFSAEEALKKHSEAANHKELLTSLFPQSPVAAWTLKEDPKPNVTETRPSPPTEIELSPTTPTAPVENTLPEKSSSGSEGTEDSKL